MPDSVVVRQELRKGELWMALRREHAGVVIRDREIYEGFMAKCRRGDKWTGLCTWDEEYVQTLLHLRDKGGIAERTVMYVNWSQPHGGSPSFLQSTERVVKEVQGMMWDTDGERHDTALHNTTFACAHNGVSPAPCFLFARKFATSAHLAIPSLDPVGYY